MLKLPHIFFVLLVFFVLGHSARASADELTESDVNSFANSLPEIKVLYDEYDKKSAIPEDEETDISDPSSIDELIAQLKEAGLYNDFTGRVKKMGFTSAEHFLTVQRRIFLGVGRIEFEQETGQDLTESMAEQTARIDQVKKTSPKAASLMESMMEEMLSMQKAMLEITPQEMAYIRPRQQEISMLMETE